MKNKKFLKALMALTVGTVMASSIGFAACTPEEPGGPGGPSGGGHTHNWSAWTPINETQHGRTCSGSGDCDATNADKIGTHDQAGQDGKCSKCEYKPNAGGPDAPASESWLVPVAGSAGAALNTTFNLGEETKTPAQITDNSLFTVTAVAAMKYSVGGAYGNMQASGNAVSVTPVSGTVLKPDQGIRPDASIKVGESVDAFTVTAKADVHAYVYLVYANDSFNSNKKGTVDYSVDGGLVRHSQDLTSRTTVYKLEVDLDEDQVLTVGATNTHATDSGNLWLFGVEAVEDQSDVTVTYKDNNDTWLYQEKYVSGATHVTPDDPVRKDHKFLGWFTSADGDTTYTFGSALTTDVTVYAHYRAADVTVSYYLSEDDDNPTVVKAYSGEPLAEPEAPKAPTGQKFDGWYTQANGGGSKYTFTENLTAGTLDLYANFVSDTDGKTAVEGNYKYTVNDTGDAHITTLGTGANISQDEAAKFVTLEGASYNKSSGLGFFNCSGGTQYVKLTFWAEAGSTVTVITTASSNGDGNSCSRIMSAENATLATSNTGSETVTNITNIPTKSGDAWNLSPYEQDPVTYTVTATGYVTITINKGGSNGMRMYAIDLTVTKAS